MLEKIEFSPNLNSLGTQFFFFFFIIMLNFYVGFAIFSFPDYVEQ